MNLIKSFLIAYPLCDIKKEPTILKKWVISHQSNLKNYNFSMLMKFFVGIKKRSNEGKFLFIHQSYNDRLQKKNIFISLIEERSIEKCFLSTLAIKKRSIEKWFQSNSSWKNDRLKNDYYSFHQSKNDFPPFIRSIKKLQIEEWFFFHFIDQRSIKWKIFPNSFNKQKMIDWWMISLTFIDQRATDLRIIPDHFTYQKW